MRALVFRPCTVPWKHGSSAGACGARHAKTGAVKPSWQHSATRRGHRTSAADEADTLAPESFSRRIASAHEAYTASEEEEEDEEEAMRAALWGSAAVPPFLKPNKFLTCSAAT
jgi:hypothetical protein